MGLLFLVAVLAFAGSCDGHSEYLPGLLRMLKPELRKVVPRARSFVGKEPFLTSAYNLTNSGTNAECYWSNDGKLVSFQAIRGTIGKQHPCDLIYTMNPVDGSNVTLISPIQGRTTCSYVLNDGNILYSSTLSSPSCPPAPDSTAGYLWPIYKEMQIYVGQKGGVILGHLAPSDAYDAESTLSPDGNTVVFTSARSGDLELYLLDLTTEAVRRITYAPGYDGGAYFSHSGKKLVWRANRPQGSALTDYLNLLRLGLVEPVGMQLYVMDDINDPLSIRMIGPLNGTNFAPSFLPDDSGIIFSSNMDDPQGGSFQLYTISLDGSNLQRVTDPNIPANVFNAFPMFDPSGENLIWCSSRNVNNFGDINVWRAKWNGPGRKKHMDL